MSLRHRHGYPAALHHGLPGRPKPTQEFPTPLSAVGTHRDRPDPPDSSRCALRDVKRRFLSYSSPPRSAGPAPSGSADARPGFVRALPPSPAPPGSGCPNSHPAATGPRRRSLTSTRTNSASRRTKPAPERIRHHLRRPHARSHEGPLKMKRHLHRSSDGPSVTGSGDVRVGGSQSTSHARWSSATGANRSAGTTGTFASSA